MSEQRLRPFTDAEEGEMNEQPDHAPVRPGSHTCVCGGWWNEHHAPDAAVAVDPADTGR